jgi:glycosyltransferase involved in cell wall biosynthesis
MQSLRRGRSAKRVIFIAYNFPPMGGGGVQRSAKFVKYLPEFGWNPVVVAAADRYYWARDDTLLAEIPPDVFIKRLSSGTSHLFYSLLAAITSAAVSRRVLDNVFLPDDRILWALRAALCARGMIAKRAIGLIYTTSPPHSTHVAGLILKRITGLPWVADFRDPWTGDFRYAPETRWVHNAHTRCERRILGQADRVICITESARQGYITDFGIDPVRLVTIYNGFDAAEFPSSPGRKDGPSDRIVITHSGSFYGTYFPEVFFRALAAALRDDAQLNKRVTVRFVGVMEEAMRQRIRDVLPNHAVFDGYVSHPEAIRAVIESDINLIALPVGKEVSYHVPGKLFEYLAAGKPILAVAPRGEIARIIESAGAGIVLSRVGVDELSKGLAGAIRDLAKPGGGPPDEGVVSGFERRRLTERLARVFDDVAGG